MGVMETMKTFVKPCVFNIDLGGGQPRTVEFGR